MLCSRHLVTLQLTYDHVIFWSCLQAFLESPSTILVLQIAQLAGDFITVPVLRNARRTSLADVLFIQRMVSSTFPSSKGEL